MKIPVSKNYLIYFGLMILGAGGFFLAVFLPAPEGFYAFVAALGLAGLGVASYIAYTKKGGGHLICPTGSNCNVVVSSKYSKFLGIKLEYMGMLYFGLIFLIYLTLSAFLSVSLLGADLVLAIILFTATAALFSSYLLFVQGFLLRAWCIWCLLASMISLSVFVSSLITLHTALPETMNIIVGLENFISALHTLGFALGLGGSTVGVFLFIRSIRDFNVDDEEMNMMQGVSEIVWVGLGLALLTQFAFYVINAGAFIGEVGVILESSTFFAQTVALLITAVSGAILLIIFAPFLIAMPFKDKSEEEKTELVKESEEKKKKPSFLASLRKVVFINGAIALVSWYFAFAMDYVSDEHGLSTLFLAYVIALAVVVLIALIWEKAVSKGHTV